MQLLYNQVVPRIVIKHDHKVLHTVEGEAAYLVFVSLEMGKQTAIYQKMSEGRSEEVLTTAREHRHIIHSLEAQYVKRPK